MNSDTYSKCVRYAQRVLPPDPALEPADLVQEAYLRALRWLDEDRPEWEQLAYIRRAVTTVALDHRRKIKRRVPSVPLFDTAAEVLGDEGIDDEAHTRVLLAPFLAAAATDPTLLLLLLYGMGWSQVELAPQAGVSPQAIKMRMLRWQARLSQGETWH